MDNYSLKKKIPTLIGILILITGITSGITLLEAKQIFRVEAIENLTPKDMRFSNISDDSFTISFLTSKESRCYVKVSSDRFFLTDVVTIKAPPKSKVHSFDILDLSPQKEYFVLINSDGVDYFMDKPLSVVTGKPISPNNKGGVIYGKVFSKSGEELQGALVYIRGGNGSLVSTTTSEDGSFMVSTSKIRSVDLNSYEKLDDEKTLIQTLIKDDRSSSMILSHLKNSHPLPPIIIGQNLDITKPSSINTTPQDKIPDIFGSSSIYKYPLSIQNIYKER